VAEHLRHHPSDDPALFGRHVVLHEMRVHALVVAIVTGQCTLESTKEMRVGFPGHGDRIADDTCGDVDFRVDLFQRVQRQLHAFFHRVREHFQRVAHP